MTQRYDKLILGEWRPDGGFRAIVFEVDQETGEQSVLNIVESEDPKVAVRHVWMRDCRPFDRVGIVVHTLPAPRYGTTYTMVNKIADMLLAANPKPVQSEKEET